MQDLFGLDLITLEALAFQFATNTRVDAGQTRMEHGERLCIVDRSAGFLTFVHPDIVSYGQSSSLLIPNLPISKGETVGR